MIIKVSILIVFFSSHSRLFNRYRRLKQVLCTYMPFLKGRNRVRIALKSGRVASSSVQHSQQHSRTQSNLPASDSNGGLEINK